MKSPLDIELTCRRYNLDEELKEKLMSFDDFIWREYSIENIGQLVAFEKEYRLFKKEFDFFYDNDQEAFDCVDMNIGQMVLLARGCFQRLSEGIGSDKIAQFFTSAGLTDLETVIVRSFLADISGLYRLDAYYYGTPPVVSTLCAILNTALSKMPVFQDRVIRKYNKYDKSDFTKGEVFTPGYCLTTSADPTWGNGKESLYHVKPLDAEHTKARAIFKVYDNSETQVTFLQDAIFIIKDVCVSNGGKKEIWMDEYNSNEVRTE